MQKSDDIFPGPLSLGSWKWKGKKKFQTKKRKATCNYFHNQTHHLLVNCPSDLQQPQKTEIKPKPNYHTRPSKRCLLSRQAIFLVIFCLVGLFGAVFIYLFVFNSSLYLLPAPLRTPMTRESRYHQFRWQKQRKKSFRWKLFPWYTVAEK